MPPDDPGRHLRLATTNQDVIDFGADDHAIAVSHCPILNLGTVRRLDRSFGQMKESGISELLSSRPGAEGDLVLGMIAKRVLLTDLRGQGKCDNGPGRPQWCPYPSETLPRNTR